MKSIIALAFLVVCVAAVSAVQNSYHDGTQLSPKPCNLETTYRYPYRADLGNFHFYSKAYSQHGVPTGPCGTRGCNCGTCNTCLGRYAHGYGYGHGYGHGFGHGYGHGYGFGHGYGHGHGCGCGHRHHGYGPYSLGYGPSH